MIPGPGLYQGKREHCHEEAAGERLYRGGRRGNLTLLEPGREIAERIYSRHRLLTHFFVQLGVDEEVAAEDACKAEHILSEQTLEKIREYALLHDAQDQRRVNQALDVSLGLDSY